MRYSLRRIGVSLGTLILASLIIFVALRVLPGDPTTSLRAQPGITEQQVADARAALGLDDPIYLQYFSWILGLFQGDFGSSYFSGYSTTELITQRLGPTLELAFVALLVALVIAVPSALAAAIRPHSWIDRIVGVGSSAGLSVPPFWVGVLLIWLFSVQLGWLPSRGYVNLADDIGGNLLRIVMPALTLSFVLCAPITRFLRAALLDTLSSEFIRTAEAKGLRWRKVVVGHALPNAMLPTLSYVGVMVGSMLGGVVVVEWVFGWPGLGSLAVDAVGKRDYVVLQGVVIFAAALFIIVSLLVDLLSRILDPRLRMGGK